MNKGIDARFGPSGDGIPIFSLTIDPNNYDIIWAGAQLFTGIYRSGDGGLSWEKRINGIEEKTGLSFRGFAIEPGNSNVVYAAGEVSQGRTGLTFDIVKGVVYKTTDGGMSWHPVWRGDNLARYVLIAPTDPKVVYVSTGIFDREAVNSDPATGTPGGVGILKSTDGGQTWIAVNNGLKNLYVGSLFMHPQDPRVLLAGAGNFAYKEGSGVYLTTDGGQHWTQVLQSDSDMTAVEFAASDPRIAYAAGLDFYRSDDGGLSWTRYQSPQGFGWGPPGIRPGVPIDFQVDPRNPMRLFANVYKGGNMLSEDGGRTWTQSSDGYTGADIGHVTVHPEDPDTLYASEKGGPYVTTDGGRTWRGINMVQPIPVPGTARIAVDPSDPRHLLMSENKDARLYESNDGGSSWNITADFRDELWKEHGFQAEEGVTAFAFAPSQPDIVYAGFGVTPFVDLKIGYASNKLPLMSLLVSRDGGRSWSRQDGTALDGLNITQIVVHPGKADIAWAATMGKGVFQTLDGGRTWNATTGGLQEKMVVALAIDPTNPSNLYAGTATNGVYKSQDGGRSWRQSSAGMDANEPIVSVVVNPAHSNVLYAGSQVGGVFVSEDSGTTWRRINEGLRTRAIGHLAISSNGEVLYAGTRGEGVFRLDLVR